MSDLEMMKTLNCGIGFVLAIDASEKKKALEEIVNAGYKSYDLGHVDLKKNHNTEDSIVFL